MSENEYLIETMTKIDSFNQWLDKYNNFDFSNIRTIVLFISGIIAPFLIILLLGPFAPDKTSGKKARDNFVSSMLLIAFLSSIILFISAFVTSFSYSRESRNLENANITLEEFQKYKPIDFDKFPEWVRDSLMWRGKLSYTRVRQTIKDLDEEKEKMKNLEKMEKRKELMNSMSK